MQFGAFKRSRDDGLCAFFATVTPLSLRTRVGPGGRVGLKQDGCCVWRELDAEIRPAT